MRRYGLTVTVICLVVSFVVIQPGWISEEIKPTLAQTRRRGQRPSPEPRKTAVDYSKFSHATKEHREDCSKCHNIPTKNWQTARQFPDVADYPDHASCVRCHR